MKQTLLAVGLVLLAGFVISAVGIKIKSAQAVNGAAVVTGKAGKGAPIFWEGSRVATANDKGQFSFSGLIPSDCVGKLSDGTTTVNVSIKTDHPILDCRPPAPVPQTGQVLSYAVHDDGDEQSGIVLPTPRFTDDANGALIDNLTALIWLKNANCAGVEASFQGALDFVASLNATGTMNNVPCGDTSNGSTNQTDWRLPNIKELESLVNFRWVNPAFSDASGTTQGTANDPFSNFQIGSGYWSSTTYAGDSTVAWGINFSGPIYLVNNGNKTFVAFVLAVRGGKDF